MWIDAMNNRPFLGKVSNYCPEDSIVASLEDGGFGIVNADDGSEVYWNEQVTDEERFQCIVAFMNERETQIAHEHRDVVIEIAKISGDTDAIAYVEMIANN